MKTCRKCHRELPLDSFGLNNAYPDKLSKLCRSCDRDRSAKYYDANKKRISDRRKSIIAMEKHFAEIAAREDEPECDLLDDYIIDPEDEYEAYDEPDEGVEEPWLLTEG